MEDDLLISIACGDGDGSHRASICDHLQSNRVQVHSIETLQA